MDYKYWNVRFQTFKKGQTIIFKYLGEICKKKFLFFSKYLDGEISINNIIYIQF